MSLIKFSETGMPGSIKPNPATWVATHADYLYAYAITRVNDEEQARDLVQDTFLAALEKVNYFEGRSSERTWLTGILKNKVIDVYRKKSAGFLQTPDLINAERDQHDFFDPDDGHWNAEYRPKEFAADDVDLLNAKEFNSVLQRCMQKLPALWLAVFTMKHIDDEPTENICKQLKITNSNFWVVIHRAKLNLRYCMQKNWIS